MKTPDEVKKGLECCVGPRKLFDGQCGMCPYKYISCDEMHKDALAYIRQLEAQIPKWVSVDDRLPADGEHVLVCDDFGCVGTGYAYMGKWHIDGVSQFGAIPRVKYWMPMPEEPREDEHEQKRTEAEGMADEGTGSDRG